MALGPCRNRAVALERQRVTGSTHNQITHGGHSLARDTAGMSASRLPPACHLSPQPMPARPSCGAVAAPMRAVPRPTRSIHAHPAHAPAPPLSTCMRLVGRPACHRPWCFCAHAQSAPLPCPQPPCHLSPLSAPEGSNTTDCGAAAHALPCPTSFPAHSPAPPHKHPRPCPSTSSPARTPSPDAPTWRPPPGWCKQTASQRRSGTVCAAAARCPLPPPDTRSLHSTRVRRGRRGGTATRLGSTPVRRSLCGRDRKKRGAPG